MNRTSHHDIAQPAGDVAPIRALVSGLSRTEFGALQVLLPRRLRREIQWCEGERGRAPDLILFGLDDKDAPQRWDALRTRHPHAPAVCLAYGGKGLDDTPVVPRPAKVDALVETIERVLSEDEDAPAGRRVNGARLERPEGVDRFDVEQRLLGVLMQADRLAARTGRDVLVDGMGRFVFLARGEVFTTVGRSSLRSLCVPRVTSASFEIRPISGTELEAAINVEGTTALWRREALLWEVAVHCSRGALPREIAPDAPLALRRWPDCTRLPDPLSAVALSALFARRPVSVLAAAAELGVPVAQVARYVTAAHALSLLEAGKRSGRAGREEGARAGVAKRWSSRILGRLARRVAGRVLRKAA